MDLNNKSVGTILDDWMDMQLSVGPDCLQLSVSTRWVEWKKVNIFPHLRACKDRDNWNASNVVPEWIITPCRVLELIFVKEVPHLEGAITKGNKTGVQYGRGR